MPNILFVCTANQFRSPLAAAYFSRKLEEAGYSENWSVSSAGTWGKSGLPAHSSAIDFAEKNRMDLHLHITRIINPGILSSANLVLVMEQGHKEALCFEFPQQCEKIMLLSQIANKFGGDIPDPVTNDFFDAQLIAEEIIKTIDENFETIMSIIVQREQSD